VDPAEARRRFAAARVARLATADTAGHPHLVPVTFAVDGQRLYSAVDHKPKRTRALRRLRNIAANPAVSLLVDHYDEDWATLWWVRVDGLAHLEAMVDRAVEVLGAKYPQYVGVPPAGPVIVVEVVTWRGWP